MFGRHDSDRGIALLTVMVIMTVLVITGSLLLRMASSESRIIYSYGNNIRAFYVAEAGADLAIKQWNTYINSLTADPDVIDNTNNNQIIFAETAVFYSQLNGSPRTLLEDGFRTEYRLGPGSSKIGIEIKDPGASTLDMTVDTPSLLTLDITGTYDDSTFEQRVQLWYYYDKTTGSYKGYGTANVPGKPLPPPGGGGPPPYTPPISGDSWTNKGTGRNDDKWEYDPATDSVYREQESPPHKKIYTNQSLNVPFSINMYAQFINMGGNDDGLLSKMKVGLGYLVSTDKSQYSIELSIQKPGSQLQTMLRILDENDSSITVPVYFTQPLDRGLGYSPQYHIQVNALNGSLSIDVSDNTGQTFNYTTAATLRAGRLVLTDDTTSHADPKFIFPQ